MPDPIRSVVRAVLEGGVELVAAYNRRRLTIPNPFVAGIHDADARGTDAAGLRRDRVDTSTARQWKGLSR